MRICRPWITRNGVRIYARDLGLKAICWEVTEEQHKAYLEKKAKEKEAKEKETSEKADEQKPKKRRRKKTDDKKE